MTIAIVTVILNKLGKIKIGKEKKIRLAIKQDRLLLKCSPPEKILIGNNKTIQNKNKSSLFNTLNIISNTRNLTASFQITFIAYLILRMSPLDKSFSL